MVKGSESESEEVLVVQEKACTVLSSKFVSHPDHWKEGHSPDEVGVGKYLRAFILEGRSDMMESVCWISRCRMMY